MIVIHYRGHGTHAGHTEQSRSRHPAEGEGKMMNYIPGFGMMGMQELVIVFGILLLLFGGTRLPQLAQGLGKSIREFKRETAGLGEGASLDEKTNRQLD
jgi:sec-independent protein translocase protein TatA